MKKIIRPILLFVFASLMILSVITFISWKKENDDVSKIVKEEEKHLIKDDGEDIIFLDRNILNDNQDTVGWIKINGTKIDYPVVQHSDNDYYLEHDFKNNNNSAGWIFMDYKNDFDDQNIVIYGHHRRDGSMFGSIDKLFDSDFYKENGNEIILIREKEILRYKIFSVYKVSNKDHYNSLNFDNFDKAILELKQRSEIDFNEDLTGSSQIITLSTCHNNNWDRLVVHGVKK